LLIDAEPSVNERIMLAVEIASSCSQAISTTEIALMLPTKKEPRDVRTIIQTDTYFSRLVTIEENLVVLKGQEHLFSERVHRAEVSKKYQKLAHSFANALKRRSDNVELIGVSGSTAYESAADSDDIDLFMISKPNRMWLTFLEALLLARVFKIKASLNGEKTDFCLSYVQDRMYFEKEIMIHKTPLFAREFLSLHVIAGNSLYLTLLKKAEWMKEAFPNLYTQTLERQSNSLLRASKNSKRSEIYNISNKFVYVLLGGFLSLKAFLRNLNLKTAKTFALFITWGGAPRTDKLALTRLRTLLERKGQKVIKEHFACYGGWKGVLMKRGHPKSEEIKAAGEWAKKLVDGLEKAHADEKPIKLNLAYKGSNPFWGKSGPSQLLNRFRVEFECGYKSNIPRHFEFVFLS
jgi:hypothetical protein